MAKFSAWFRSFSPFSAVYEAGEIATCPQKTAEAYCSAGVNGCYASYFPLSGQTSISNRDTPKELGHECNHPLFLRHLLVTQG